MDLFTQIKMAVSVKEAAEYYGLGASCEISIADFP